MAKMKLYYSPSSPYARKVRAVAIETGLDKKLDMVNVALTPVAPNPDVDKHNPIGKIPALSVKGMDLFDSPVICEYLDSQHKRRKLLPRKGRERWVALRLQAMGDGLLDAALLARYEGFLRPEEQALARLDQGPDQEDRRRARPARGRDQVAQGQAHHRHHHRGLRTGLSRLPLRRPQLARQAAQARQVVHDLLQAAVDEDDGAAGGLSKRRDSGRDHRTPRA